MNRKGFTLIELLVVIAIIGILSSVVLASLNTARSKGSDAAVKAQIGQLSAQAAIFYDTDHGGVTNTYSGLCTDSQFLKLLNAATTTAGANGWCKAVDANNWAAMSPLKSSNTSYWCIDGTGYVGAGPATSSSTCI